MIEQLKNCPNCGGILDDAGRCGFCGSKVYDFLSIDFTGIGLPNAKTYIRIKTQNGIILAPVYCPECRMTVEPQYSYIDSDCGRSFQRNGGINTTIEATFRVCGDMIEIKEET